VRGLDLEALFCRDTQLFQGQEIDIGGRLFSVYGFLFPLSSRYRWMCSSLSLAIEPDR
jgi:hypothetical protein